MVYILLGTLAILPFVLANTIPRELPTINTTAPGPVASACCFVVQDTITEEWWKQYETTTTSGLVNLTSITTLITPYPNTTITNVATNIYPTNTSYALTTQTGSNPLKLLNPVLYGPIEIVTARDPKNVTQIVTAGVTIQSPTAFNIYTAVKIITVPAVSNSAGQLVCATQSTFDNVEENSFISSTSTRTLGEASTYSGINSNAENYFGSSAVYDSYFSASKPSGVVISFTTPFVHVPKRGETGAKNLCEVGVDKTDGNEAHGYVPQTLIDYIVAHPVYKSIYPGIEGCLPGGPSIISYDPCGIHMSEVNGLTGGLTSEAILTVLPAAQMISQAGPGITPPNDSKEPAITTPLPVPDLASSPQAPAQTLADPGTPLQLTTVPQPPKITTSPSPLIITSPTTILLTTSLSLPGSTTVISGNTFVVITAQPTAPVSIGGIIASLGGFGTTTNAISITTGNGSGNYTGPVVLGTGSRGDTWRTWRIGVMIGMGLSTVLF